MAQSLVVIDTSVILKWVLPSDDEPDAARALQLREAILDDTMPVLLPQLWLYEVGNTIARRFPVHAAAWLSALMKFALAEAVPSSPWITKTLELTARYDATFYDACYHALAMLHKGVLVTADTKYFGKAREAGSIALLSEWQPPARKRKADA